MAELTVAAEGGADFRSIAAAVRAAGDGDVIVVGAGTYRETVTVDRPVAIRGARPGTARVVVTVGMALDVASGVRGSVSGLTLESSATDSATVVVRPGATAEFDNCRIQGEDGVVVDNAALALDRCRITARALIGVGAVGRRARVTVRASTFVGCADAAMQAREGGRLDVRDCAIEDCAYGLVFRPGTGGRVSATRVTASRYSAVLVDPDADPRFSACTFRDSRATAVQIRGGRPRFANCLVDGASSSLYVADGGRPVFQDCRFTGSVYSAITLEDSAGVFEDCEVACPTAPSENVAMAVLDGSTPTVRRLTVTTAGGALVIRGGSAGSYDDVTLTAGSGFGLQVEAAAAPHFRRGAFRGCRLEVNDADGVYEDLDFVSAPDRPSIAVTNGSAPVLRRCTVRDAHGNAFSVVGAGGRYEDCVAIGGTHPAFAAVDNAAPTVIGLRVRDAPGGLLVRDAGGSYTDVQLAVPEGPGVQVGGASRAVLRNVSVGAPGSPCRGNGFDVSTGSLHGCSARNCTGSGFLLTGQTRLDNCAAEDCDTGLTARGGPHMLSGVRASGNRVGIAFAPETQATLTECDARHNHEADLLGADGAEVALVEHRGPAEGTEDAEGPAPPCSPTGPPGPQRRRRTWTAAP
ncbi:right-handed parallel beta-helix repeat-containing protein [Yinghuangia sp. YIM S09857]|uniref:right-handed parallel beta-helix repeat-containing protein n=1 Tax=Yinghuangia sp. YIM S09857 TaxID=3436929 RepID=UPI003F536445